VLLSISAYGQQRLACFPRSEVCKHQDSPQVNLQSK
jgi:hypothetical protein